MLRISFQLNKNLRLEKDLKQVPLVDSAETTHHSPAKLTVISTPPIEAEVRNTRLACHGVVLQKVLGELCSDEP
jgi:hypothetical protein